MLHHTPAIIVISRSEDPEITGWHNVSHTTAKTDSDLRSFLAELESKGEEWIHLSGGSELARSVIGLGLVDEYNFFVFPTISEGPPWFESWPSGKAIQLMGLNMFKNGVAWLRYSVLERSESAVPSSFSELLAK